MESYKVIYDGLIIGEAILVQIFWQTRISYNFTRPAVTWFKKAKEAAKLSSLHSYIENAK